MSIYSDAQIDALLAAALATPFQDGMDGDKPILLEDADLASGAVHLGNAGAVQERLPSFCTSPLRQTCASESRHRSRRCQNGASAQRVSVE
jgi:hypothetical protein